MTEILEERPVAARATSASAAAVATRSAAVLPSEFLSFRLGGEEYGIDILRGRCPEVC